MPNWEYIDKTYVYDGSFEGFLTVVFLVFETRKKPAKIASEIDFTPSLLDNPENITTDLDESSRVFNGIISKISDLTLHYIYEAFLSNDSKKELNILEYLILGFEKGPSVDNELSIDSILYVQKLSKAVGLEKQRLKGFVRFVKFDNDLFYSGIEPDNNILEDLGKHFARRLSTQNFIIHDKKRRIAFLYNQKEYMIIDVNKIDLPKISEEEKLYQDLWKTFFKTIAIKERTNKRLQLGFMPKRYWKNMFETH